MRLNFDWWPPFLYWSLTSVLRFLLVSLTRWRVRGRENVPTEGPVIVVANHLNIADPVILGAAVLKRRIRFMAKVELFKGPLDFIVRSWGAFPVRRFEADIRALIAAERLLSAGWTIGMFPEGTRSSRELGSFHRGTALIALRTGAPVLPCAITGTQLLRNPLHLLRRPAFTVVIGEPIAVEQVRKPTEEQVSELTEQMWAAVASLLPPEYVGSYTGGEVQQASNGRDCPRE